MRLLDRYFGGEFARAFAFSILAFSSIMLLAAALDLRGAESAQPARHLYLFLLYSLPRIVVQILPAALMFAVCFTVAQFTMSRELVAVYSAGVSFYRALLSIFVVSAVAALMLFFANNFLVTPANRLANEQEELYKKGTRSASVKDLVFQKNLRGRKGFYFLYYFDRAKKQVIGGFNYFEIHSDGRPRFVYQSQSAQYEESTGDWLLSEARYLEFDSQGLVEKIENVAELRIRLPDDINFFARPSQNPNEMNIFELSDEIDRLRSLGFNAAPYQVEFHVSLAFPALCIILAIAGSIAGNMGNQRSGGPLVRAILLSTITILIYYFGFSIGASLGRNNVLHPAVAGWGPTGIFLAAMVVLVIRYRR